MAAEIGPGGRGMLPHACSIGTTGLGGTRRRIERGTLWCGEADISVVVEVRAVAIERWVEGVEIG